MRFTRLLLTLTVSLIMISCSGGGGKIVVEEIVGPDTVHGGSSAQYSVFAEANDPITFQWTVDPPTSGEFSDQDEDGSVIFTADEVTTNTQVLIIVLVHHAGMDPVLRNKEITITNGVNGGQNEAPEAAAHVDSTVVHTGDHVKFYDDSTDPDGTSDIVKWEWDFSYDSSAGFRVESLAQEPTLQANDPGIFQVQLRVTDSGGLIDMLDIPLEFVVTDGGWVSTWTSAFNKMDIAVDGNGNTFISGNFNDEVDFDLGPGVDNRLAGGFVDACLVKFGPDGNFLWANTWGGDLPTLCLGDCVGTDNYGNIYVAGNFNGIVDFDPGTGIEEVQQSGDVGAFLVKFDPDGRFVWVKAWDVNLPTVHVMGLATDTENNIFITSTFKDLVDFDPGPGIDFHQQDGNGSGNTYVTKFNTTGEHEWAATWGTLDFAFGRDVTCDDSGNAYVTGYFTGVADLDPGDGTDYQGPGGWNGRHIHLSKFNAYGEYQWGRTWHGESASYDCSSVAFGDNQVYVGGLFYGTVDFDPGVTTDEHISSGFVGDSFITAYSINGDYLWTNTWGGSWNYPIGNIAADSNGNVFAVATAEDPLDLDPGPGVFEINPPESSSYVSMFEPDGGFVGAQVWGLAQGTEAGGYMIAVGDDLGIYIQGIFQGPVDFDPGPGEFYSTYTWGYYLLKLFPTGYW